MSINVLFAARPERWEQYRHVLPETFARADLDVNLSLDHPPHETDYIIYAPNSDVQDFTPYTRLKAVLNLWAGVENITHNTTLKAPLCRMVDYGLRQGMVEWVTGHTLRHHLGMDTHILNPERRWEPSPPPLAKDRRVTILGLGALGLACAEALHGLGFQVSGWSRRPKSHDHITCLSGDKGLEEALKQADILVLLLPLTPETKNVINDRALALMPKGSFIINPGRGPLIDDEALLGALESGQISHTTLDVFRIEPLPQDHPYWAHPKVTVTPHIASETRPETCAEVLAENIRRGEAGLPFLHLVDRGAGY